jgi:hypothetical protein
MEMYLMNVTSLGILKRQWQPNPEIMTALEAQRNDSQPKSILLQSLKPSQQGDKVSYR